MKVAVLGGNGQLGTDVASAFRDRGDEVYALGHSDIEVADVDSVKNCLAAIAPDLIVNTVAMHHVESCESAPEKAFAINAIGARNVGLAARELDAAVMYVSTDYVFDGTRSTPYDEEVACRPLNVYGVTKLAGEHFVQCATEKHFVVRTSALYGKQPCRGKGGLNFVELMLKLAGERDEVRVVADEMVSPTSTKELANQIVALGGSTSYGLYHASAEGSCSWYEFAREIFALTGVRTPLRVASSTEFAAKVPRPKYSVLENRSLKLRSLSTFGTWQVGLRDYLGLSTGAVAEPSQ